MSREEKYNEVFFCKDIMSLSEYVSICWLLQSEHSFPAMGDNGGASVKYVDSEITLKPHHDTRDCSVFSLTVRLRGFGSFLFVEDNSGPLGNPAYPTEKKTHTGVSMYSSMLNFLNKTGHIAQQPLSAEHIGRMRWANCLAGEYTGKKPSSEMVALLPELSDFQIELNTHVFEVENGSSVTGYIIFDANNQRTVVYSVSKMIMFRGHIGTIEELCQVLRLCGIKHSW